MNYRLKLSAVNLNNYQLTTGSNYNDKQLLDKVYVKILIHFS